MTLVELVTFDIGRLKSKHALSVMRLARHLQETDTVDPRLSSFPIDMSTEDIASSIADTKPDILGLPGYIWTINKTKELSNLVSELSPQTVVVIGGSEVILPSNLTPGYTGNELFVSGEGEIALEWIAKGIGAGLTPKELLVRSDKPPEIYTTASPVARPRIHDLQTTKPMFGKEFLSIFRNHPPTDGAITWESSRGCFYDCGFCDHKISSTRAIPEEVLVNEISGMQRMDVTDIYLVDPIAGGKRANGMQLFRNLTRMLPDARIKAYMRPELLTDEYIEVLAQSNIEVLQFGIQSLNPAVPNVLRMNNLELVEKYLPKLTPAGVPWRADLIVGLPGDTMEDLKTTVDQVISWKPTEIGAYPLTVLRGTPLERLMLNAQDYPYMDQGRGYWVTRNPETLRAEESSSYSGPEMTAMKRYGGIVMGVYNFHAAQGEFLSAEELARRIEIVDQVLEIPMPEEDSTTTRLAVQKAYLNTIEGIA